MSWFFGKKKHHKDSPPNTPEEGSSGATQQEDYVIIDKDDNPERLAGTGGGLYPNLGGQTPGYPPQLSQQSLPCDTHNYLSGIPFELSKRFNDDFEIESLRIDEITSFIHRLNNEILDYDFGVERSVMNEIESSLE